MAANDAAAFARKIARLMVVAEDISRRPHFWAEKCAEIMRGTVPVLTGETQRSIVVLDEGRRAILRASSATVYLQFGTSFMAPQPFYGNAIRKAPDAVKQDVPNMQRAIVGAV